MPFYRGNEVIYPVVDVRCLRSGSPSRKTGQIGNVQTHSSISLSLIGDILISSNSAGNIV